MGHWLLIRFNVLVVDAILENESLEVHDFLHCIIEHFSQRKLTLKSSIWTFACDFRCEKTFLLFSIFI